MLIENFGHREDLAKYAVFTDNSNDGVFVQGYWVDEQKKILIVNKEDKQKEITFGDVIVGDVQYVDNTKPQMIQEMQLNDNKIQLNGLSVAIIRYTQS